MSKITEILKKYDIRPNKRLGQNFLIDLNIIDKIITEAQINENTTVIEIGGGVGSLTGELLDRAKKVIVIELDSRLCDILKNEYKGNLTVINADILKTDIDSIIKNEDNVKVCGNLPYYITTPIIMHFIENIKGVKSLSFMMQKEVADRVTALCKTKCYGAITPVINYYADAKIITTVPSNAFIPKPAVNSAVVMFEMLDKKRTSPKDEKLMFSIIKAAFGQRRKTLLNALTAGLGHNLAISKDRLAGCITNAGINPSARGETLSIYDFSRLSDVIFDTRLYTGNP